MADASGSLALSASELRSLTDWPDSLIEEFLSLQRGVSEITSNINIVINNVETVVTLEGQTRAGVLQLKTAVAQLQEYAANLESLNGSLRAKVNRQNDQINDMIQLAQVADFAWQGRLNNEIQARKDLAQEVAGG